MRYSYLKAQGGVNFIRFLLFAGSFIVRQNSVYRQDKKCESYNQRYRAKKPSEIEYVAKYNP